MHDDTGGRMKREDKSRLLRKRIIDVSRKLFIRQGYSHTTIRQILNETGITTGSLYNFYNNKESILKQIAADYLEDTDTIAKSYLKSYDPIVHYTLIIFNQLRAIDSNSHLADIWNNAYSLWSITEMICINSARRNKALFGKYNGDMSDDDWYARSLAINSLLHYITLEKINRGEIPLGDRLRLVMHIAMSLFNLPPGKIELSIIKAEQIMSRNTVQLYGFKI